MVRANTETLGYRDRPSQQTRGALRLVELFIPLTAHDPCIYLSIYLQVDDLVPHLPAVVRDGTGSAKGTDPTQETCARSCGLYKDPTQQHELDHTDHTDPADQDFICPELSKS